MKHLTLYILIAAIVGLVMPFGAIASEATVRTSNAVVTVNEAPAFPHHHFHFRHAHHHRHHHHRRHHHRR
ncbi:MAG TPA: hypothetical protein VGM54_24945 [Chthoniobacter sp.]